MSLFKIKQWWSNENLVDDKSDENLQNAHSVKVDRFNVYKDSDCVILGQGSEIKIYKPNVEDSSHIILESQLTDIILQIGTGKFTIDAQDRQIIVLHPKSFVIYCLDRKEGHIDLGDQNSLKVIVKHSFNRKACSIICGPFGSSKSRDFICVQALDGTLSFFDQDTFLFMCIHNDVIIPGPVCYVPSSDLFLICKPTWVLETYSYQQLNEFSELSVKPNKKNIPQWTYNPGEEVVSLQVIRTSSNFSSIIALGERHMYCFQDNGLMKFMIRFDYMPTCFHAYLIGWYYEPNSRLLIMVASEDSQLYIYEGTTLLWSCGLLQKAISISRCFLKSLSGGLVSLSPAGVLNISYLGTEPDLNSSPTPMNEFVDPEQIQRELESVEESLQRIMGAKEDTTENFSQIDKILQIKADIGKPTKNALFAKDEEMLMTSSIVVILTCVEPETIKTVQITYDCHPPIVCTETAICLDNINGTEIIESGVYVSGEDEIYNASVNIVFTIVESTGKISILSKQLLMPLNLYCVPVDNAPGTNVNLSLKSNLHPIVDFADILIDFNKEEIENKTHSNTINLAYRTSNKIVTITAKEDGYMFAAEDFCEIYTILIYFMQNIKNHYLRIGKSDYRANIDLNPELNKLIVHRFFKCIENHAKQRAVLNKWQNDLNILQRQFTLVQKRLLVQYGSVPPGDCDPLEFLMRDTHQRIVGAAKELLLSKKRVCSAGNSVSAAGHLLVLVVKQTSAEDVKVKLLEEVLSLDSLSEQFQEWEECVFQASSHFIKKILKKSEKDKEKLAPVTGQDLLSHNNLKKLIKQLRIVIDRLLKVDRSGETKENVTRIEELVEVI